MTKQELIKKLTEEIAVVREIFITTDDATFFTQPHPEKWSIAQHLQHLIEAVKGIATSMKTPSVLEQFGTASHTPMDYETIKQKYKMGLQARKAAGLMPYRHIDTEGLSKAELIANFDAIHAKLLERMSFLDEKELNSLQIPHPIIGILILKEMLIFTAVHIRHHIDNLRVKSE